MKYQDSEGVEIAKKQMIAEKDVDAMSEIFDMFGDSTRLKIMNALFAHELCVSDLASLLEMSTSAISHQLSNLKKTKLVRTRKIGKISKEHNAIGFFSFQKNIHIPLHYM